MTSFLVALVALVIGYAVYGKIVDSVFGPTDRPTPAVRLNDGVDYMPLPTYDPAPQYRRTWTHIRSLAAALAKGGPGGAVYDICVGFLGTGFGATLAMLGVIACPITSGDTAFRSARLTLADWFGVQQKDWNKRLAFAIPLLAVGGALSQINFSIIWRYFSWTNQTLAMIVLWTGAVYLYQKLDNKMVSLMAAIPATFMSVVTTTYILQAEEGLKLPTSITYPAGFVFAAVFLFLFLKATFMRASKGSGYKS